jgi:hypothetical protein
VSQDITVDDCQLLLKNSRELLTSRGERQALARTRNGLLNASLKKHFDLAKNLVTELEEYLIWFSREHLTPNMQLRHSLDPTEGHDYIADLIRSFELYDGISYDEYVQALNKAGRSIIKVLFGNMSLPITLLINDKIFEAHSQYLLIKDEIEEARKYRISEIVDYCRGIVPYSENMTDKIVLSVAGIKI